MTRVTKSGGRHDAVRHRYSPAPTQVTSKDAFSKVIDQKVEETLQRYPYLTDNNLWTAEQLANFLQVSMRTLSKVVPSGDLKPVQTRPRRLFKKSHIDAFLRASVGDPQR
jgi:excisionase family DNA binding protein